MASSSEEIKINIRRPTMTPLRNIPQIPRLRTYAFDIDILSLLEDDITNILRLSLYEDKQLKRNTKIKLDLHGHRFSTEKYPEDKYPEKTCSICMEEYKTNQLVCQTDCKHIFHKSCLQKWVQYKPECPLCRDKIQVKTV